MKLHKVLLVPDSFKGTLSSIRVCTIMKKVIAAHFPDAEVVELPVADGGEGSVDCFLTAMGGRKKAMPITGPYGETVPGFYGVLPDHTAVVEMAAAAGLPLAGTRTQVEKATTYGVGQLIRDAARSGCRRIVMGLGGSATNDGGAGAAAALGVKFYDAAGQAFVPVGQTLMRVASVDLGGLEQTLAGVELRVMCDVDNPLCGPQGAAAVFGPQKGADAETVRLLDENLAHLAAVVKRDLGRDIAGLPGAGAAGGLGGGMAAFLGCRLEPGIEVVLDAVRFDERLHGADLVFSGEGRLDSQSLRGKVVAGVAGRCKRGGVPLIAVVGDIEDPVDSFYAKGVRAVCSINRVAVPFSQAKLRSAADLERTMDGILRLLEIAP